jgi:hypothetical protein
MELTIAPPPLPIAKDAHGSVRVGGTHVTLETAVTAFSEELVYHILL